MLQGMYCETSMDCLSVSVIVSFIIRANEYTRFKEKFPKTFSSHELREWIIDLDSPRGIDAHRFLWSLHETIEARGGKAKWEQMTPCILRFFNPADLAMGKVMSSDYGYGTFSIVFKCADIAALCIQLVRLIGG